MSNFLLEAGRQTLMLELQEASRLPERLGDDFIPRGGNHHPLRRETGGLRYR
ncbi:Arabinose 5-phosphate isomerase GutQ [Raoultella planticola]|uniref:Arabinose 5-phosphate isomerase GutQ n=1 Tax=Raoultella planticola TaxID=575 RepID=A0A485C7W6_RAOPL|nr:Arabinose 5-phosphate isomerase GutQ [Raoultella planticola]